jgi:hypothetical protein
LVHLSREFPRSAPSQFPFSTGCYNEFRHLTRLTQGVKAPTNENQEKRAISVHCGQIPGLSPEKRKSQQLKSLQDMALEKKRRWWESNPRWRICNPLP